MIQFSLNVDPIYIIIYFSAVQKMNSVKWGKKWKWRKQLGGVEVDGAREGGSGGNGQADDTCFKLTL